MTAPDGKRALVNRYELSNRIGTGGMADVYLGRDRVLGRTVAVKTLLGQFASDPSFIARFRREAQSAASLNHPHIVGVYDTGSDDGRHFIVMEYIEGKTLRDVIREEGPLQPERAVEIASDVCAGLGFAHSKGIVHRDVKPANIMMTTTGGVKVTDFGIARAMTGDTVTQTAAVMGTAQYFSPEQAQAAPVDARSDIYSLGVVLYEMLTRQVPFTGSSPVAIAYKHVKEDPLPPSRLNPDIAPGLEAIVMKALAKNPGNRYQSAGDMRADLLRLAEGKPVQATPVMENPIDRTAVVTPVASDETIVLTRRPVIAQDFERARRRRRGWIVFTLLMLAIAGILVWAIVASLTEEKVVKIVVPNVVGSKLEDAQKALRAKGLRGDVVGQEPSDQYPPDTVTKQDPEPPNELERGQAVKLTLSVGPELIEVPNVLNKTRAEAEGAFEKARLTLGTVSEAPSDTVAKGRIIDQDPNAGARLKPKDKVDIKLSTGKETAQVPPVVGRPEDIARDLIENRGLKVVVERRDSNPTDCAQPPGRVCRQDPAAGTEVDKGSDVKIVVAQEPLPSPTASAAATATPTATPTAFPILLPIRRRRR